MYTQIVAGESRSWLVRVKNNGQIEQPHSLPQLNDAMAIDNWH